MKTPILGKTFRVPAAALELLKTPEHLAAFTRLCGNAQPVAGVYDWKGCALRLRAGQVVTTFEDFGKQLGLSPSQGRRRLDAFRAADLIDTCNVQEVKGILAHDGDGIVPPKGTLVTIKHMKDDPRIARRD